MGRNVVKEVERMDKGWFEGGGEMEKMIEGR